MFRRLGCVEIAPSDVHGHGLKSRCNVDKGADIFNVVLPDCGEEQGFTLDKYDDYTHLAHKDGHGAALIDAGSTMEGTLRACHEDMKMGHIRAMNHAGRGPDANVFLDIRDACMPDWYFPAGGVTYTVWYSCHVIATRAIRRGEELRFEYAWVPEDWE